MRNITTLDTDWRFIKSATDAADAAAQKGQGVTLPHTWNNIDGQDGGNDYHRGTCWYVRELAKPAGECAHLEFAGAAMTAEVYLNGKKLARHEGGYSTFRVNLTEHLQAQNTLVVSVDNGQSAVYPQMADFTFYGGLYRDVKLITVPESHFDLDYFGGSGLKITPVVTGTSAQVTVEAYVTGNADTVTFAIDGQTATEKVTGGCAVATFQLENAHLWDGVDDPFLYTATATLASGDAVSARFGCRSFRMDPQQGFILNGRAYPLRGVSRHQDRTGAGSALTLEMQKQDMQLIKEIGANTLRLAHYQHSQEFYDLCDENGIVVWAEIPYISMHMPAGRGNTLSQMQELVVQNYNHPSIVCWGLSNEITAAGGVTDDIIDNHRQLNELCHKLDATRPTTMADVFMLETDSPLLEIPDINSYNLYFGWYLGELIENDEFFDDYHAKYPDRCIGFSEYGADANPQYQSSHPERGDYSETYQCVYHEHMLRMIEARPYLWATHVWNMFDFAADGRDEGGKHGENQKGLITMDRKLKKDAFYLYKAYWSRQPFVHLCGSRYVDRCEDVTEVKVYSNLPSVTLLVDGKTFATQQGSRVFTFNVPLTGEHNIEAKAGECASVILVRKVAQANLDYKFNKVGDVINWFDKDPIDVTCYSIADTLGELAQNEQANQMVQAIMNGAAASRGDIAETVKDNPSLQRMMMRQTLQSMLKHAGDAVSPEQAQALNAALQKIKKA